MRTTLVPYLGFWFISVIIFNNLYQLVHFKQWFPIGFNELKGLVLGGQWLHEHSNNFGLWFLQMHFIASVLFEVIVRYFDTRMKILAFLLSITTIVPFQTLLPGRPVFHINILPAAISFMFIGYYLSHVISKKGWMVKVRDNNFIGVFLMILGWRLSILNHYGDISHIMSLLYIAGATLTILGLYILCGRLTNVKILNYIGAKTLHILGLHGITFITLKSLIDAVGMSNDYVVAITTVTLSIISCCGMVEIYDLGKDYLIKLRSK